MRAPEGAPRYPAPPLPGAAGSPGRDSAGEGDSIPPAPI